MIEWQGLLAQLQALWDAASAYLLSLWSPYVFMQAGVLLLVLAAASLVDRVLEPRLEARLRAATIPPRRMRVYLVLLRRTRLIAFVLLSWGVVAAMRMATWPSRSYAIAVVANLATAWLVVAVASRVIRNNLISRALALAIWVYVALAIIGVEDRATGVLDAAAINFGGFRLSLLLVLQAAVTLTLLFWLAGQAVDFTERRMSKFEEVSPSMRVLVAKLVRIALFALAAMIGLQTIGFDLTSLTVLSGAIGVGIGFGLQKIVSNLVSGLILLMDRSIKPGDVISLGDTFGWITSLGARYVSVVTRDGREYLIPNEDLITGQVVNWSYSSQLVRLEVDFGVSYDADPHAVRKLAVQAAATVARVEPAPQPVCHLTGFGESSVDFVLRFWIPDPSEGVVNVKGQVLLALWDALKAAGIEIPYPKRDVYVKSVPPRGRRPVGD